jgi:hypothetical protein
LAGKRNERQGFIDDKPVKSFSKADYQDGIFEIPETAPKPYALPQVDGRDKTAAQIENAADKGRGIRKGCQLRQGDHFLDVVDIDPVPDLIEDKSE